MNGYYFTGQLNYISRQTESAPHNETGFHSHKLCELLYFESGEGELVLENKKQLLFPGALVILPRGTLHYINILSDKPYRRSVISFMQEGEPFDRARVLDISGSSRIISVFSRMRDYSAMFSGEQKKRMFSALVTELVLLLGSEFFTENKNSGSFITKASAYIDGNIESISGIDELCESLHISRAQLYREFKNAFDKSPMRFINEKRLERAQNLLRLGEDSTKVCESCGFGDYSAFYRAYKAYFGYSPNKTKIY